MNSLRSERVFMRSIATRRQNLATSAMLASAVSFLRTQGFGLVLVETAGIGQSDSEIVDLVDIPVYVMTSEYGAASQLEKIDMLDLASVVVVNKADKRGADDALRDVRKQWRRNRVAFGATDDEIPVFPTDREPVRRPGRQPRVRRRSARMLAERPATTRRQVRSAPTGSTFASRSRGDDPGRPHRLPGRDRRATGAALEDARRRARGAGRPGPASLRVAPRARRRGASSAARAAADDDSPTRCSTRLRTRYDAALDALGGEPLALLRAWPERRESVTRRRPSATTCAGAAVTGENYRDTLSGLQVPKVAAPRLSGWGDLLRFLMSENLPGAYPVHGGRLPLPARGRGSDPDVRRRRHARADEPPLPLPRRGPVVGAPLDGVRLGHALRREPGRAPRHLGQGRQLRRLDRDASTMPSGSTPASTSARPRRRSR